MARSLAPWIDDEPSICEAGTCITPKGPLAAPRSTVSHLLRSRPAAPASAGIAINGATQAQLTRNTGPPTWHGSYAAAFTVLSMKAWGGITTLSSIDLSESVERGVSLAGCHTFGPGLHLGGYLSYVSSELNAHVEDEEGDQWTIAPLEENDLGLGQGLASVL